MTTRKPDTAIAFSRDDTKAIKGIAVVLMLFHHLAAFPNRFPVGFAGFRSLWARFVEGGYLQYLAISAKLCVTLFFFLGGYGLYKRFHAGKLSVTSSVLDVYRSLWKVFAIFIPIALIFFVREGGDINPLATVYALDGKKETLTALVANFTNWSDSFNGEWWFVTSYVCALPMGYLYCCATKKLNNFWAELFIVFALDILIRTYFPALCATEDFAALHGNVYFRNFLTINSYATTFFAGIVIAKYDGICVIKGMIRRLPLAPLLSIVCLGGLYWSRTYVAGEPLDILYAIVMIPLMSVVLDAIKPMKIVFGFLGKHSTNIWLIHSFYAYYFLEVTHLVYIKQNVWVDLLILIALSLLSSILLEAFYRGIGWLWRFFKGKWEGRRKPPTTAEA